MTIAVRDVEELGCLADVESAVGGQVAIDDVDDASGPGRHDDDAARQERRLGDRMGDEDDRLLGLLPEPEELFVEMVAGDLVQGAERLVHQQKPGSNDSARAIETRCCMPPESCQGNLPSKPVRLTSSN